MNITENPGEITLKGGANPIEPVLVANTVRRPAHPNAPYIHALLKQLEVAGVSWAPRFLGIDEQGREILTFIQGDVLHHTKQWEDAQLRQIVRFIKQLHDATEGTDLAGTVDVVCHNDIAPWNTVFQDGIPVALIDFNDAAPGKRVDDMGYFLWVFLDLGNNDIAAEEQGQRMRALCDEYGNIDSNDLIATTLEHQQKVLIMRQEQARQSDSLETKEWAEGRAQEIKNAMDWVRENSAVLRGFLDYRI